MHFAAESEVTPVDAAGLAAESRGKSFEGWFSGYSVLKDFDGKGLVIGNGITSFKDLWNGDSSLTSIRNISHWDVSNITNMANLLKDNSSLETYGEFGTWAAGLGTGKLVNISGLLYNNDKLTNDDLAYFGSWDVTGVTDMSYLLYDADAITTLVNLENWRASSLQTINYAFAEMEELTTLDGLADWAPGRGGAVSLFTMAHMLENDLKLSDVTAITGSAAGGSFWDVSNVTDFSALFKNMGRNVWAQKVTKLDLSRWDMRSMTHRSVLPTVTDMMLLGTITAEDMDFSNFVELTLGPNVILEGTGP